MPNEERTFTRPNDRRGITWPARRQVNPPPTLPSRPVEHVNNYGKGFVSGALTEPTRPGTGSDGNHYSFKSVNASDDDGPKVLVFDGLVGTPSDNELPSGMGSDNYTLDVSDGDEIYVGITYDTDTFEITSRFLDVGETPDNEFGANYFKIIDVSVVDNGDGTSTTTASNAICGDIIFDLKYMIINGVLSVQAIPVYGDAVEVPEE